MNLWYLDHGRWSVSDAHDETRASGYAVQEQHKRPVTVATFELEAFEPAVMDQPADLYLAGVEAASRPQWFALPHPAVALRCNGSRVVTRMAALQDRDVLTIRDFTWVFTTEVLARVEQLEQVSPGAFCPRCKLPIEVGHSCVRCPGCQTLHHQDESIDKLCWSYAMTCAICDAPTSLSNPSYTWTPNAL